EQAMARITLYVAGDAPSSRTARRVLEDLLGGEAARQQYRLIDVLAEPASALEAGLIATPTLVIEHDGAQRRYVGDLCERATVLREMLDSLGERSDSRPDAAT
ncbi:MAG TPA: circadian clock KaiB family protein, partial [Gammaproteobacteria bacterium]|nr:circadian clock KaiB family protein [Gammaproteobacteria bacterium]